MNRKQRRARKDFSKPARHRHSPRCVCVKCKGSSPKTESKWKFIGIVPWELVEKHKISGKEGLWTYELSPDILKDIEAMKKRKSEGAIP